MYIIDLYIGVEKKDIAKIPKELAFLIATRSEIKCLIKLKY